MSDYKNPRPSPSASASDPCVVYDNSVSFDKLINESEVVTTYKGVELQSVPSLLEQIESEASVVIQSIGWDPVGEFATGFTYTKLNDVGRDSSGSWWRYNGSDLPKVINAGTIPSSPSFSVISFETASNVQNENGGSVQSFINASELPFDNVADLRSGISRHGLVDMSSLVGGGAKWDGYYSRSDGGGNCGIIKSGTHVDDGGSIFSIDANTYVEASTDGVLNLLKWGGKRDLSFDSTPRFNAMMKFAVKDDNQDFWDTINNGTYSNPHEAIIPCGYYSFTGTALVPSNVTVDLDRSVLVGNLEVTPNYQNANIMFVSAYINSSGVIESNLTQPNEVGRCVNSSVVNGVIAKCFTGIKTKNFNENCLIENIAFFDVAINVDTHRGFYSVYRNLFARCQNPAIIGAIEPSYRFTSSVNAIEADNVNTVGRKSGALIDGAVGEGTRAMIVTKCGFEECDTGLQSLNPLQPLILTGNTFEFCGVTGLDLSNASAESVIASGNWFGTCGVGVKALASVSADIAASNTFKNCGINVSLPSDIESNGKVSIPPDALPRSNDTRPAIPAKYILGKKVKVDYPVSIYNTATGLPDVQHNFTGGLIDLPFTGSAGHVPNGVPFCELAFAAPSVGAVDVYVRTTINYTPWEMLVFRFEISDNIGTHIVQGRIMGLSALIDGSSSYPVTILDSSGKIRFKVSGFSGSGTVAVTGIIRHM